MATGTNKPVGSTDPRDLLANAGNLDEAVNDPLSLEWTDRKGNKRKTWRAIEMSAPIAVNAAEAAIAAEQSIAARTAQITTDATLAAVGAVTTQVESARDVAVAAKDGAELARDAAIAAAGPLYATEAEGRAAVADGESFNVQGVGEVAVYTYRRTNASSSVLLSTLPASAAVVRVSNEVRQYKVIQGNGRVVIDATLGLVRYPILAVSRPGESRKVLTPASGAAGYFDLPLAIGATQATSRYHYIDMSLYGTAQSHNDLFKSTDNGVLPPQGEHIIPLGATWYGGFQSLTGQEVVWLNRPSRLDFSAIRNALIWDRADAYAGGAGALYVPKQFFLVSRNANVSSSPTAINEDSAEMAGYVKLLPGVAPGTVQIAYFDSVTNEIKLTNYANLPQTSAGGLPPVVIASLWGNSLNPGQGWRVVDTSAVLAANQFNYARGDDVLSTPWILSGTTIGNTVAPELAAMGITKGGEGSRPYLGGPLPAPVYGGPAFARVYVELVSGATWPTSAIFFPRTDSAFGTAVHLPLRKIISPTLRVFEGEFFLTSDSTYDRFLIGVDAAVGVVARISGVQFANQASNCGLIRVGDYPRMPAVAPVTDSGSGDAAAVAMASARQQQQVVSLQRPTAKYNVKVLYGQSLGRGQETWPALSRTARFGNLQLGGNVLPAANDGETYPTFGAATLQPLIAQTADGATLLTPEQEAALAPGNQAFGEPPNHAWVNFSKHLLNQAALVANDDERLFVTFNPSVSGKTIEQLSKVNSQDSTNRYARYVDGLTKIKGAAGIDTCVVDGICWMQGEYNYANFGGSWDKATYKSLLTQLISDMQADAVAVTGQQAKPAFLMYQTGAAYTQDVDSAGTPGLHIGMAQLETALERNDVFMVGPIYPYTDKGGHLDSNGSRWFGHMIGKVWDRVVRQGRRWLPLMPTRITASGREVLVEFHVPAPPLQFDRPYVGNTATDYAAKGFKVTDSAGTPGIASVQLVGQATVKITLSRDLASSAYVWYADKAVHNGNGCLRDSDSTVALDNYVYEPARGMYASANIPALVNKPYPLHNWCVAFYLPVGYVYNG